MVTDHMQTYCRPSMIVWGLLAFNPCSIIFVVVLLVIPLFQCCPKLHKLTPNILKGIGFGLLLLVIQDSVCTILIAL